MITFDTSTAVDAFRNLCEQGAVVQIKQAGHCRTGVAYSAAPAKVAQTGGTSLGASFTIETDEDFVTFYDDPQYPISITRVR